MLNNDIQTIDMYLLQKYMKVLYYSVKTTLYSINTDNFENHNHNKLQKTFQIFLGARKKL